MSITGIINEEWRSVSGYANYQVSNFGRVRNVKTERILKPRVGGSGKCYFIVALYKDNTRANSYIHRLVAQEFIENSDNKKYVDHIDHNKTDNTILNLRWVSNSENSMNRTKQANTSSKYKGVCFRKKENKWVANIMLNGRRKHIGYFTNEKHAAGKYNEAAIDLFGEHAFLNEISSDEEDEEAYEFEEEEEEEEEETDDATA